MALLDFSGFAGNSLANLTAGGYFDAYVPAGAASLSIGASAGPFGGAALQVNSGNTNAAYIQKNLGANYSTLYFGEWWQITALPGPLIPVAFYDSASLQVYLKVNVGGQISIYNGSNTLLATNPAATLTLNRWTFVEVGIVFNGSTGSVELKFNGSDVISLTGSLNTAPSGNNRASAFRLGAAIDGGGGFVLTTANLADYYLCDNSGALNNTFLGPGQAYLDLMTANDATQFTGTPNTGSNTWENISNNPSLLADYNFSATATQQDTFAHAALPGTVSSILGVKVSAFWGLDAAGSRTAQVVAKSGATTSKLPASPATISPGFSWGTGIYETDPNTSAAWTVSNYNTAKIGYYLAT